MYSWQLYHGTNIERGNRMLANEMMEESIGDRHWLGDGSYFYEDDIYAYKWISDMFKSKFKRKYINVEELFNNYIIIFGILNIKKERVFDLENPQHKILFDRVMDNCKRKQEFSKKYANCKVPDGVTINIMFNILGYKDKYDVVKAMFIMRQDKYRDGASRLNYMPEKQICLKNISLFKPKQKFDCLDKCDEFEYAISMINFGSRKYSNTSSYKRYNIHNGF